MKSDEYAKYLQDEADWKKRQDMFASFWPEQNDEEAKEPVEPEQENEDLEDDSSYESQYSNYEKLVVWT